MASSREDVKSWGGYASSEPRLTQEIGSEWVNQTSTRNDKILHRRDKVSGLYNITTAGGDHIQVYNDMETPSGPWIVIQRRTIGDVDFYREWADYKMGFGDLHGDFWIGNDNLNLLTTTPRILRVELEAEDGEKGYAEYSNFTVANEGQKYKLFVGGFSGNLSFDAMENHHDQRFSTYDQDNDRAHIHCAVQRHGGWWYKWCYRANLNGRYMRGDGADLSTSMNWWYFPNGVQLTPLSKSKMMIR
ncbi:ficolin-1-like [Argopecten irradians]|uniref:ficolin-1-like n=1 Tax=Argopecten irradians TaxID=31199 RepID=UPI0037103438